MDEKIEALLAFLEKHKSVILANASVKLQIEFLNLLQKTKR